MKAVAARGAHVRHLAGAARRVHVLEAQLASARAARDDRIRVAVAAGMSYGAAAAHAGVSRAWAQKVAKEGP